MPKKASKKSKPVGKAKSKENDRAEHESVDQDRFVDDLVSRGEAVPKRAPGEKMPSGTTHEIVGKDENGKPIVKRNRFSAF